MRNLPKPPKIVDLHAEAFLKNIEDYSQDELIGESIIYMREMLDAAIYWNYTEIKFIHGKGKGILKQEVFEELAYYKHSGAISSYYPSYQNEDIVVVQIGL